MNNKKSYAGLGGCSAEVDNTLFDLHNSSYPTQPHSLIANYDLSVTVMPIHNYSRLDDYIPSIHYDMNLTLNHSINPILSFHSYN